MNDFKNDYIDDLLTMFGVIETREALVALLYSMNGKNEVILGDYDLQMDYVIKSIGTLNKTPLICFEKSTQTVHLMKDFFGAGKWDEVTSIEIMTKRTYPKAPFNDYVYAEFKYE